ncbi:hypothetical protein TREMEDRAFT_64031 [Tremella mesenterica DSM 1558]|uniref:uncharacterized protein n=1 Tax=Tremella mesenterica (strain ATCC 24925 / CBS 8224 / DSM 1558 / NBRC 9311 / NRRL Y-6157 / RJB 2259-6 / UBC 559-6) TaxID=578456 RepID=UPI0003F4A305|nr:uncharacterized protein TREMEDRAFT_64031 [Tremella mesenterica DSM 1558]EIW68133.1 hypothetical protein TREMEDRAFT_64031 [Tremella mesenterica DSM 1558]
MSESSGSRCLLRADLVSPKEYYTMGYAWVHVAKAKGRIDELGPRRKGGKGGRDAKLPKRVKGEIHQNFDRNFEKVIDDRRGEKGTMFVDHLSTVPELDNAFKQGVNFPNNTKKLYDLVDPLQYVAINYNPIISVFYAKEWDSTSTSRRWIIFGSTRLIPTLLHFHLLVPTRLARSSRSSGSTDTIFHSPLATLGPTIMRTIVRPGTVRSSYEPSSLPYPRQS